MMTCYPGTRLRVNGFLLLPVLVVVGLEWNEFGWGANMAFAEKANDGVTNGATDVDLVAAPAAATKRLVRYMTVYNADTTEATILVEYEHAANQRMMYRVTLQQYESWIFGEHGELLVLDDTDKSIVIHLTGVVTANELHFTTHYADVT